jgi:glycerol-3-phosphate O-acyltransferase
VPIVLLPTHRSYLDFLIISYVFFVYNLRLPNFVADEAILQANFLPLLIKSCGAFFYQKKLAKESALYRTIFDKYLELLLKQGNTLEFFIEGTRSRTGKILAPNFEILNVVLDTIIYGKVQDVCLIPMTVNYEKVLEGDTFPGELLGEEALAESMWRVIKALPQLRKNHGRVYIEICKPMYARPLISKVGAEFGGSYSL